MKATIFIASFSVLFSISYSQNISIERSKQEIISVGTKGDTIVYLSKYKIKKSITYSVFYKKDSSIWSGRTFFSKEDFDGITNELYSNSQPVNLTGLKLKKKAKIELNKEFAVRVGMMPTFGWYVGKKKPGRYKQIGYRFKVMSNDSLSYDGYVYYYFQKQSFFKRFFKKHRLKKRIKKLPVIMGSAGPEIIFKNDKIEEGGQVKVNYYTFKLKE